MVKRRGPKDDGIAILPNGVRIPEATRDALLKHNWAEGPRTQGTGGFNPDNATTKELEAARFSGFRINEFTQDLELWLLGGVRAKCKAAIATPKMIATMHEEVFATTGSLMSFDADGVKGKGRGKPK